MDAKQDTGGHMRTKWEQWSIKYHSIWRLVNYDHWLAQICIFPSIIYCLVNYHWAKKKKSYFPSNESILNVFTCNPVFTFVNLEGLNVWHIYYKRQYKNYKLQNKHRTKHTCLSSPMNQDFKRSLKKYTVCDEKSSPCASCSEMECMRT